LLLWSGWWFVEWGTREEEPLGDLVFQCRDRKEALPGEA
jgi:hypothetical protein